MKVSIVIPIYAPNPIAESFINNCIYTLRKKTPLGGYELILVDDGSQIRMPIVSTADIAIYKLENTGFTNTVNLGLKVASGDVIVVANDDVEFRARWMESLLDLYDRGEKVGITSLTASDEPPGSNRFGSIWSVRQKVIDKVGLLDEEMKHYFSDLDFHNRLLKAGFSVEKRNDFVVRHIGRATYRMVDPDNLLYAADMEKYREKYGRVD